MPSSQQCNFDVSHAIDLPGPIVLAGEFFPGADDNDTLLVCYPGGGNNRHYFDLSVAGAPSSSFAQSMSAQGWPVMIVDHLGIGDSTRPDNGFDVTVERVIATHHALIEQLRQGGQWRRIIAVGHSMGAMLAIFQQHEYQSYDAMALLGFGLNGLPDALNQEARDIASEPQRARQQSEKIARLTFDAGYFELPPKDSTALGRGDTALGDACLRAIAPILAIPSAMSLVPRIAVREIELLDIPVFVANGDRDLAGPTTQFSDAFPQHVNVTSLPLIDCGHNHFLYPARDSLYRALHRWLGAMESPHATFSNG